MKVILLQDIPGLGKKYDVKEVRDGYVRNFLLPKKLVEAAAPEALKKIDEIKKRQEQERQKNSARLKKQAEEIQKLKLIFSLKTDEKGNTFGSITNRDIEQTLVQKGIQKAKAGLEHPVKTTGEFIVPVDLGEGIKIKLEITVKPEQF